MTKGIFHRWYDQDEHMREMVLALERMTQESQALFGHLIYSFPELLFHDEKRTVFFEQLTLSKLYGLIKAKRKRRWYDHDPVVHKAFKMLYSLSETHRAMVASQLYVPARLVRDYEQHCHQNNLTPDPEMVHRIIQTCFTQGHCAAETLFQQFSNAPSP